MTSTCGAWHLESIIAVGGLAEVWRATRSGGEPVALKLLHTHLVRNAEACELFATEQLLARSLPRHENVVHADDAGAADGRPWLALELVDGLDLRRLVAPPPTDARSTHPTAPAPQLPRDRMLTIMAAACAGVAHLHRHGWVHGDVCPSNLVVSRDRVVLVDLGVARRVDTGGTVRGTHAYMAPEQVRGEPWTTAVDVFALGVVLWELLSERRLFHRGPAHLTMAAVVEQAIPPLHDPLSDIVAAALSRDPDTRPTASTLSVALTAATSAPTGG